MNAAEFWQLVESSGVATDTYLATLPQWVHWWMSFMGIAILPAFIFAFKYAEARVIVVAMLYSQVLVQFIIMATGPNLLWGLGHVLFWLPALIYIGLRYQKINWRSIYGVWLGVASATMAISVIFDIRDVSIFFMS